MNRLKRSKTYIQTGKCSALGRAASAFLLAIAFFCIFGSNMTAGAGFQYKPVKAQIVFDCMQTDGIKENSYRISIKPKSNNAPAPDQDTITVNGSGKGEFTVEVSEPGTYEYSLRQIRGSDKNIRYDEAEYDVYVNAESGANGELVCTVSVTLAGTDKKPERVIFKNNRAGAEETTKKPEEVDTGDRSGIAFYLILALLSFAGLIVAARAIRTRES